MAVVILQYISILLLCPRLVMNSAATNQSPCYPSGSIACKIYNQTRIDCANRNLVCIPLLPSNTSLESIELFGNQLSHIPDEAFKGLHNLISLDLSSNNISDLYGDSFNGLHQLLVLNLFGNSLTNVTGTSFRDLTSLQTLDLRLNLITSLTATAFATLTSLEVLHIDFSSLANVPSKPFITLPSLQDLTFEIDTVIFDCGDTREFFTGLIELKHLAVGATENCTNFCPLTSLETLILTGANIEQNITDECWSKIPLKHTEVYATNVLHSLYKYLHNLTSLSLHTTYEDDNNAVIQDLNTLNSPLQNLSLSLSDAVILNSTTFECVANWNATLTVLEISADEFWIGDSSFKWFPNLHILWITGEEDGSPQVIKHFSKTAFNGLINLQELHLNYLYFNVLTSNALGTFSTYNTLKVLDLAHNDIEDIMDDQLTSISSLAKIDLSDNKYNYLTYSSPRSPNLTTLLLNKASLGISLVDLEETCNNAPNLAVFDATFWDINVGRGTCRKLVALHLDESTLDLTEAEINVPQLQILHMAQVRLYDQQLAINYVRNITRVLKLFKSHNLQILDLSSNDISTIDKEDAMLMRNLTELDLSNNQLTSLGNLHNLKYMQTLFLSGNKLRDVIESFLSKSSHPRLQSVNLNNNPLVCDCSIVALRNWLLTDKQVFLYGYSAEDANYCCSSPDSKQGFSITEIALECKPKLWMYISIGIACFIVVVITTIIVVRYRWHIQYIRFLLFNRRPYQNNLINNGDDVLGDDEDEDGVPRYDAYVIYHVQDEDWVDGELLANIEEGEEPFRLCLKTRDIRAGRLILNELSLHIQRSRKIIAILSPHFVDDNWCHFELNMAHRRLLEENPNVLIFILLEELPQRRLTLLLRQLFCRVLCLKWPGDGYGQYLFWQRLREELKRPVPLDRRFQI
ncbi:uncharacterized protein [Amphiura filiformis]|uniref:uncharacterized protein n=1 Tax=Amphiura filiformis TaxID=82378 RepID=UPI003B22049C